MGWATTHFQLCVATLQWCRARRDAACMTGALKRMTEDPRARAVVPRKACRDRHPWVLCCYREFPVVTELAHPVSQDRVFGSWGFWCRDSIFTS